MPYKKVKCAHCPNLHDARTDECRACYKSTAGMLRRFWSHVDKSPGHGPHGDCWLWTGGLDAHGYGRGSGSGKADLAHRNAYIYSGGVIPEGMKLCHKCDHPPCVRPEHMFAGTQQDNIRDMASKGRHPNSLKTCCPSGHTYDEKNTYQIDGRRYCKACRSKKAA